jgi:hypothetical protein
VVEVTVQPFLLVFLLVDAELQLTDDGVAEEEVDEDVVVLLEHPVLYLHDPQVIAIQLLHLVQQAQNSHELMLLATVTSSQQVTHLKSHQIDFTQLFQATQGHLIIVLEVLVVFEKPFSGRNGQFKQGVDESIQIVEGIIRNQLFQFACKDIHVDEPADVLALHVLSRKHTLQDLVFVFEIL